MINISRGRAGAAVFLLLQLGGPSIAGAQTYPARGIQIVVPVASGGGTDLLARNLGQKVAELLGQPVVIDNKLGAGGNIGVDFVARAKPDGYTLLVSPGTIATNVAVYRKLPYDLVKDFEAITLIGQTASVLVVNPLLKVSTVKEFVDHVRAHPNALNFGSAGTGSPQHLHAEFFNQLSGTKTIHIPYKGQSQAMNDLLGGQLQYMFSPLQNALPHIKQGRLRALAVATIQRNKALPDVPTLAELGYKDVDLSNWFAVYAPAGTSRAVVQKLYAAFVKIGSAPEMQEKLATLGFDAAFTSPDQTADFMRAELVRWARVAAYAGIQAE